MAIKQLRKSRTNLANTFDNDGTLKSAALFTVDREGKIEKGRDEGIFLLNPSSWNETKTSNWAQQNVPGQSDPVLQWVSSGPRTVSFQALVTADTSDYVTGQNLAPGKSSYNKIETIQDFIGVIAAQFSKTSTTAPTPKDLPKPLDISNYLNYYRSLLYPIYDNKDIPHRLQGSPPLVVLFTGSAINRFSYGDKITSNQDLWVVTSLEINITKQLPNLAPMEAVVSFQLMQYNVRSFDRSRFLK